jgi:hypothetical protein
MCGCDSNVRDFAAMIASETFCGENAMNIDVSVRGAFLAFTPRARPRLPMEKGLKSDKPR